MSSWWVPLPVAVATAPGYRALSLAAVGALAMLYLAAAGRGVVEAPDDDADRSATVLWGSDGPGVLASLEAGGFVACDGPVWRLRHAVVMGAPSASANASDAPTAAAAAPQGDGPVAGRLVHKRLAAHWSRRGLRSAEDRAAWHLTEAGGAVLSSLGLDLATADDLAGRAGTRGGRFGLDRPARDTATVSPVTSVTPRDTADGVNGVNGVTRDTATVSPTVSRLPLPHTPSLGEREEKETRNTHSDAGVRAQGTVSRGDGHGVTRDAVAVSPVDTATVPRCPTVEATGVDAERALIALRTHAPRALSWAHDATTLAAWQRAVRDLDGHIPTLTLASYELAGEWLAAGGLGWWSQGRPSLAYLLRPGVLARLLDDAAEWASAGRPKITHRGTNADAQGAARRRQDAARGMAPVSPPGSYARKQGEPDALEKYLVQPLHRPTPTGTAA